MAIKFVSFVDKDEFETFILAINQVNDTPLIIFGPEIISCNTMDVDEQMMFSGTLTHFKSSIKTDETFNVAVYLPALISTLATKPPGEVALMFDGVSFYVEWDPGNKVIHETVKREPIELPKFDYPLKMDIETSHLEYIPANLSDESSIIFSREKDGLLISNPTWDKFITVHNDNITYVKSKEGSYSTMVDTKMLLKALEIISLYDTVLIGLGEDIPLILLGTSDRLKLGYMIAAQVEEG